MTKTPPPRTDHEGRRLSAGQQRPPSPAEIAERCCEIQATWSRDMELRRRHLHHGDGFIDTLPDESWTPPRVTVSTLDD